MTFSIVARCPKTLALGVAVSTAVPAVGSVVPHVEVEVGAIATQAQTNVLYGIEGLQLLKKGLTPHKALEMMLAQDKNREKRQVSIIDAKGRTAAYTGKEVDKWKGHYIGKDYIVAGNMLVGSHIIKVMSESFGRKGGSIAERLLESLKAGQDAGGDRRGRESAALVVVDKRWKSESRPRLDLRVDLHPNPVEELCRIHGVFKARFPYF